MVTHIMANLSTDEENQFVFGKVYFLYGPYNIAYLSADGCKTDKVTLNKQFYFLSPILSFFRCQFYHKSNSVSL